MTWLGGTTPGRPVPLQRFYTVHPEGDSAATIYAALDAGKDLLLTPGTYDLAEPMRVKRKDTVILGLGLATLHPVKGTAAMTIADVDGVTVSGLLLDAGEVRSPKLLRVGSGVSQLGIRGIRPRCTIFSFVLAERLWERPKPTLSLIVTT